MPGMYRRGEYDLAGCIVGVVDRAPDHRWKQGQNRATSFSGCRRMDCTPMAIRSRGKSCFERCGLSSSSRIPGVRGTLGEELLRVHKNYQPLLAKVPRGMIHGLAHITGGGLIDNLPRDLAEKLRCGDRHAQLARAADFQVPAARMGKFDRAEMYQVFNMGIGMVAIVRQRDVTRAKSILHAKVIGRIERGSGKTKLSF